MADISKILIPALDGSPGGIYNIKDTVAREMLSGGINLSVVWNGYSIPNVANIPDVVTITYNDTVYNGTLAVEDAEPMTFYLVYNGEGDGKDFTEYAPATNEHGDKYWERIGTTGGSMNNLGALAFKDTVEILKGDGAFVIGKDAVLQALPSNVTFGNHTTQNALGRSTTFNVTDAVYRLNPRKGKIDITRNTNVAVGTSSTSVLSALDTNAVRTGRFLKNDTTFTRKKIATGSLYGVGAATATENVDFTGSVKRKLLTDTVVPAKSKTVSGSDLVSATTSKLETTTIPNIDSRAVTAVTSVSKSTGTLDTDTMNKVAEITVDNPSNNEWKDTVANLDIHMYSPVTDGTSGVFANADSETIVFSFKTIPSLKIAATGVSYAKGNLTGEANAATVVTDVTTTQNSDVAAHNTEGRPITVATGRLDSANGSGDTVMTGLSSSSVNVAEPDTAKRFATGSIASTNTENNNEQYGHEVYNSISGTVQVPRINGQATDVLIPLLQNATNIASDINVVTEVTASADDALTAIGFEQSSVLSGITSVTQPEYEISVTENSNGNVVYDADLTMSSGAVVTAAIDDIVPAIVGLGTATAAAQSVFFADKDLKKVVLYDDLEVNAVDNPNPTWLYFTLPQGGTVTLTKNGTPTEVTLEYSVNDGRTWTEWVETENVRSLTLAAGQTMHVRNISETSTGFSTSANNYYQFAFTTDTYSGGNTNSLLCRNPQNAVIVSNSCYSKLFSMCNTLITAPDLPSTTLTNGCYYQMFLYCSSLTNAPKLPAEKIKTSCYYGMFANCSSLVLPDDYVLPGKVLEMSSYGTMFSNCNNVNIIHTNMIDISASNSISNWLRNVSPTGDFYCPAELTIPTGASGIPSGWTRHDI